MSAAASDARPDGYEVPVVAALTEPVLMAGVPRDYAILMGTIAAVLGLALKIWWLGVLWWAVAHAAGLWAARQVPQPGQARGCHPCLPQTCWPSTGWDLPAAAI